MTRKRLLLAIFLFVATTSVIFFPLYRQKKDEKRYIYCINKTVEEHSDLDTFDQLYYFTQCSDDFSFEEFALTLIDRRYEKTTVDPVVFLDIPEKERDDTISPDLKKIYK